MRYAGHHHHSHVLTNQPLSMAFHADGQYNGNLVQNHMKFRNLEMDTALHPFAIQIKVKKKKNEANVIRYIFFIVLLSLS